MAEKLISPQKKQEEASPLPRSGSPLIKALVDYLAKHGLLKQEPQKEAS